MAGGSPGEVYAKDGHDVLYSSRDQAPQPDSRVIQARAKREVIAGRLRETPKLSNRRIARVLGVDHKTVLSVQGSQAETEEVCRCDRLVGRNRKERARQGPVPDLVRQIRLARYGASNARSRALTCSAASADSGSSEAALSKMSNACRFRPYFRRFLPILTSRSRNWGSNVL